MTTQHQKAIKAAKSAMEAEIRAIGLDGQSLLAALGAVESIETGIAAYERELWQQIETLKCKDGTMALGWQPGHMPYDMTFVDGQWMHDSCSVRPTHWRSLPTPPSEEG